MVGLLADSQRTLRGFVRERTLFSSTSATLLTMGFSLGYLVTFLWGASRLAEGTITYVTMLAFIQLVGQIQGPFREITRYIPLIISSLTASERLMELQEAPIEKQGEPIRFPNGAGLRINNVSFAYDETSAPILQHFGYDFPPRSITAVLGETGTGKTTLIRLILALLKPQEGTIDFYDEEGKTAAASPQTRCNLIYVPQGNSLFSGTVRDNLLLGNPNATEAEMHKALWTACAEFVLERSEGLETPCGELGAGLSEGQAQRIAIARALLRSGNILLLDEATSALDPQTEQELLSRLKQYTAQGRTVICVTHRPAVLAYCTQELRM
jgi:ABC-type multidrug transport system fused ATPase/permease subunit